MASALASAASDPVSTTTFTSAVVTSGTSTETVLELHSTTFFDYGSMPRVFLSMIVVPRGMFTASLSAMRNASFVRQSSMRTCKSIFSKT